eukprot:PhF_6_TR14158/c0_g1_i1/m.22646
MDVFGPNESITPWSPSSPDAGKFNSLVSSLRKYFDSYDASGTCSTLAQFKADVENVFLVWLTPECVPDKPLTFEYVEDGDTRKPMTVPIPRAHTSACLFHIHPACFRGLMLMHECGAFPVREILNDALSLYSVRPSFSVTYSFEHVYEDDALDVVYTEQHDTTILRFTIDVDALLNGDRSTAQGLFMEHRKHWRQTRPGG